MSKTDTDINRIITHAEAIGYTAINIDTDPPRLGQRSAGYTITAEAPYQGRIVIAQATSWARCYKAAMDYLR